MTTLTEGAFAKINLTLDVLGKRPDGYHDISSVMQTISIRDDVEIRFPEEAGWRIVCDREDIPTDETNLAWKAAECFYRNLGGRPEGLEIRLTKRIPSQAGLAGGSADAAAVLRALNRQHDYPLSVYALSELGAQVGSDVPFCVLCGTALVEGRGDRLTKLADAPEMFYVVCKPQLSFSTPELYRKLDETPVTAHPDAQQMRSALLSGDLEAVGKALGNVFEEAVSPENPEINYIRSIMMTYGAYGAQMTGSGSAVFGLFDSFEYAAVACTMLKENYPDVFIAKNV